MQAAPCARLTIWSLSFFLISLRCVESLYLLEAEHSCFGPEHTHTHLIYIRVGIRIVLKAVRRIQLYYSWRWPYAPEDTTMEEGDDGGAVTHCGATRALARNHTATSRRRPRPAGVAHERHGRDLAWDIILIYAYILVRMY